MPLIYVIFKIFTPIDTNNDSSSELKDYIIDQYDVDIHDIADDLVEILMELLDADANGSIKKDEFKPRAKRCRGGLIDNQEITNMEPDATHGCDQAVEVQSLVMVPIHQDTSSVPLMTTPVINPTVSQPDSTSIQASLPTSTTTTAITTTTFPPPLPQPQQGISNSIII
ncbi:magnesium transporter MRS2-3-like protein [Tanacetum coccineum]